MSARTPRSGNCFALLACMHARTHARTHAHSTVRSVWVCQLVRSVRLSVRFFSFTCFLSVFEFACRYAVSFLRMSRGFRLVGDLESVGSRFARVFTRTLSVCVACSNWIAILLVFLMFFQAGCCPDCVLHVFSCVFSMSAYIDCCMIAFRTCFLEYFCKCATWILKIYVFLEFCRRKYAWCWCQFYTCFRVYFDDLSDFFTPEPPQFSPDFRFDAFS